VDPSTRQALELELRRRFDAGDLDGAMTAAVNGYGQELFGFLVGLTGDRDRAGDVFGAACERIWVALPGFRWQSSFRVWMYAIARNQFLDGVRKDRRLVPLSAAPSATAAIAKVRSTTPPYLRTESKEKLARLRETLSADDHALLGLRLDRKMAWSDIARILGSGKPSELARDAAALRKRYQRLKERLETLLGEQ
jgi:RNA polymerase sigma factor (sigma-70 family)